MSVLASRRWMVLAIASGCSAAANGVFAKLTTTSLTVDIAHGVAKFINVRTDFWVVEYIIRGIFFLLNLLFNAIMWTLFTMALKAGDSATRVSILNTSANFMVTALAGWALFSEKLPGTWWIGASFLVIGNVIIARRDEHEKAGDGYQAVDTEEHSSSEDDSFADEHNGVVELVDEPHIHTVEQLALI